MFKQASTSQAANALDPLLLVQQMKEDGLAMKKSALDTQHQIGLPSTSTKVGQFKTLLCKINTCVQLSHLQKYCGMD